MSNHSTKNMGIYLRNVELSDIKVLFKWRNHPLVRKNSFNSNLISWAEHAEWFETKTKELGTTIYMACSGEDKIGTIRFEYKDDAVKVSVMLNPDYIGKGLSSEVIMLAVKKYLNNAKEFDKPLIAEVKRGNTASVKAFEKVGFKESHLTLIYDT